MLFYWIHILNEAYSMYSHYNVCLLESPPHGRIRPLIHSAASCGAGAHV